VARSNENNKEHRMTESQETPPPESFTKEELKRAMKAFKKRLKMTRLDDESRLGYGPMSGGGGGASWPSRHPTSIPWPCGKNWSGKAS